MYSFSTYQQEIEDDFREQYPDYENCRIEVTEDGRVYIHGVTAYPAIVKHGPTFDEWNDHL